MRDFDSKEDAEEFLSELQNEDNVPTDLENQKVYSELKAKVHRVFLV